MNDAGRIADENVLEYKPSKSVLNTPNMTADEITEQYWKLYERLYSMKNILRRTLFNKRFLRHPARTLFFFGVNMIYRAHIKRRVAPNIL